jgi:phosphopantothenoylcysteine synthetase/decarboxylase
MSITTNTTACDVIKTDDDAVSIVQSFVDAMNTTTKDQLQRELQSFVVRHASHHRPIALVSSGGTAADLERQSVRCLENFSTGTRGAISVEEFLKRGYAVIHLWRSGSASPYGRLLSQGMGIAAPNQGITMASLGKLFATGDLEEDQEDQLVQSVLDDAHKNDQWLSDASLATDPSKGTASTGVETPKTSNSKRKTRDESGTSIQLHRRVANSNNLRIALIERQAALEEGRILTVPFRSVEEYLAKLQLSAKALRDNQALVIFFLAAAVSDFYIPPSQRSEHKIQSGEISNGGLTLTLSPVPKVIGLIRSSWSPDAFVCSFKLETDKDILRKKAEAAVEKYGCHMVIGNLLETRHSKVWILSPSNLQAYMDDSTLQEKVQQWPMLEISKPKSTDADALEVMIMDYVVQAHFEYISASCGGSFDKSGTVAVLKAHQELDRKRKNMDREAFWNKAKSVALEWAEVVLGAALSYMVSAALRRRLSP